MRNEYMSAVKAAATAIIIAGALTIASFALAETGGPTVVLTSSSATTTSSTIPVTATFSEDVSGLTSSDISATNATVEGFSGSGSSFTFDLAPSSSGSVTVMIPADIASSTATTTKGNQASNTLTFTANLGAPVISNISVSAIGTGAATINWATDIDATGQVFYGTTTAYGHSSALNSSNTTSHAITLASLLEATTYHFKVQSTNASSTATSSDMTFVTASTASTTPLAVTGTDTVQGTATADDTFLHGFKWVMHLTVPDTEDAFRMKFSDFTGSPSGTIPTASNVRIFSPQSSNAANEGSAITETNTSYGGWLNLTGDTSVLTAGRQIDVTIEVRVPSGTPAGSYTTTFGAQSVPQSATSTTP
ncbi:MAG TPA: Ig-like domain-containing protein [Candidatus Paceibacterota bacterium]